MVVQEFLTVVTVDSPRLHRPLVEDVLQFLQNASMDLPSSARRPGRCARGACGNADNRKLCRFPFIAQRIRRAGSHAACRQYDNIRTAALD